MPATNISGTGKLQETSREEDMTGVFAVNKMVNF
jgi:hypothetical protein